MPRKLSAVPLTEAEIARLAQVDDVDQAAYVAAWKADARGPAKRLIEARLVPPR